MGSSSNTVLCINGGSSSLKVALYRLGAMEELLFSAAAEGIGGTGRFVIRSADHTLSDSAETCTDHGHALARILDAIKGQVSLKVNAVGHRIVHGGPRFTQPQPVTPAILDELNKIVNFAPLHLPVQIALIQDMARHYPDMLQVACFDTAFHSALPEIAQRFALPRSLWDEGIKRYGFHGLSYEYIVANFASDLGRRTIIAHLGNGASMAALLDGKPVDTSMGLTPTGGFMMGTRSGDLDPGVLLFLLRSGRSVGDLAELLDHQSGLKGVSAGSGDMKDLLSRRKSDARAAQAVDMFCYQIAKFAGSYAAVLGGIDTLVFTGGIGEHAAEIREGVTKKLTFLGIDLDSEANSRHSPIISSSRSRCTVRIIPTNEDLMIARHTLRYI